MGVGRSVSPTLALISGIVARCVSFGMLEQSPDYATNVNGGHKVPQHANLLVKNSNNNFLISIPPLAKLVYLSATNAPTIRRHAQNGIWQSVLALLQPKTTSGGVLIADGPPCSFKLR